LIVESFRSERARCGVKSHRSEERMQCRKDPGESLVIGVYEGLLSS